MLKNDFRKKYHPHTFHTFQMLLHPDFLTAPDISRLSSFLKHRLPPHDFSSIFARLEGEDPLQANRALLRREILHTDSLTPPLLRESMLALEKLADIRAGSHGGYPEAERCRISVKHPDVVANDADVVVALSITRNFKFQPCNHGDFLGSILGTGITREKVGDIILQGEKGAQVIVVPELL